MTRKLLIGHLLVGCLSVCLPVQAQVKRGDGKRLYHRPISYLKKTLNKLRTYRRMSDFDRVMKAHNSSFSEGMAYLPKDISQSLFRRNPDPLAYLSSVRRSVERIPLKNDLRIRDPKTRGKVIESLREIQRGIEKLHQGHVGDNVRWSKGRYGNSAQHTRDIAWLATVLGIEKQWKDVGLVPKRWSQKDWIKDSTSPGHPDRIVVDLELKGSSPAGSK